MSESKPTSVVAIIEKNGKILATSRKTNHSDFGLPGGKVEPGESLLDALRREVREETGLEIYNIKHVLSANVQGYPIEVYSASSLGTPSTSENLVVKWTSWAEVLRGSFGEFNKRLYEVYKTK